MEWQNKQVLVVGKGKSGRAAYRRLSSLGAVPVFYDDHDFGGEYNQFSFLQVEKGDFDFAVTSPGVKPDNPIFGVLQRKGVPTMSESDLGYLLFGGKIIAVTGTNGKTTTVRLSEAMLLAAGVSAMAVGNVGIPFSGVEQPLEVAVVEMSSFQCHQSVLFRPQLAAITNVAPDHVEWHGTYARYREAKLKLVRMAQGYALNLDDQDLPRVVDKPCYTYSLSDTSADVYVHKRNVYVRGERVACVEDLPLRGNHNLYNAMCALALCTAAVGYRPQFARALHTYRGERMRTQQLTFRRPYVFNDSKGTNTSATLAALRQMVGSTALLLGGWDKGEDFTRLFMHLAADTAVIAFGQAGARIYREAVAYGIADCTYCPLLADAVRVAFGKDKDNVLFSPACSSFDAYGSYVERGVDFEKLIHAYL